jgi:HEAT repeat protein
MPWLRSVLVCCFFLLPLHTRAFDDVAAPKVRQLIQQLQGKNILDSQDAAEALGKLGPVAEEAVPALAEAMKRESVARPAAFALAAIGPKGILRLLEEMHRNDDDATAPAFEATYQALAKTTARSVPTLYHQVKNAKGDYLVLLQLLEKDWFKAIAAGDDVCGPSIVALPYLIHALKREDWRDRVMAADALARLGPLARPAIPALLLALEDEWPLKAYYSAIPSQPDGVRASAVKALLAIGPAAEQRLAREGLPRLIAGVGRGTEATREHTAFALGLLGSHAKRAIPALVEQMRSMKEVRDTFVNALAAIGPESVPTIEALLKDPDSQMRRSGLAAMREFQPPPSLWLQRVSQLAGDPDAKVCEDSTWTLVALDPEGSVAVPILSGLLQDSEKSVRNRVLFHLEDYGPLARSALPALWKATNHQDTAFAEKALDVIICIGGPTKETTSRLIELLRTNKHSGQVALSLIRSGKAARSAVPVLVKMLDHPDPEVMLEAAWVLAGNGAPEARLAVAPIIRGMKSGTWKESGNKEFINILVQIGPPAREAVPLLLTHLADPHFLDRRSEIAEAIAKIGGDVGTIRPVLDRYLQDEDMLHWAVPLAAQVDPEGSHLIPACMAALLHYRWNAVRSNAAVELGKLGTRARLAIPRLQQALEEDEDAVRYQAAAALIRITGKKEPYADLLIQGLRRSPHAAWAMDSLPTDSTWAVSALIEALSDPAWKFQTAAASSLVHFGPAARPAVQVLIRMVKTERAKKQDEQDQLMIREVVGALGAIGPAARDATPLLRDLLRETTLKRLSLRVIQVEELEKALRGIEGEKGSKP